MSSTETAKRWLAGIVLCGGILGSGCAAAPGSDEELGDTSATAVEALAAAESSSLADEAAAAMATKAKRFIVDEAELQVSFAGGGLLVTQKAQGKPLGSLYLALSSLDGSGRRLRFVRLGDVSGLKSILPRLAELRAKLAASPKARPAGCDAAKWAVAKDVGLAAITLAGVAVEAYFVLSGAALLAPVGCVLAQWYACAAAVLIWTVAPASLLYLATHNPLIHDWAAMRAACGGEGEGTE